MLAAVPPRYGTVGAFLRAFVPAAGDDGSFAERMTVRFSGLAPINDPASLYKPIRKVIHRGHPEIRLTRGNHAVVDSPFAPLRGWFPSRCFHFPLRSAAHCEHKARLQGKAFEKHIERTPTAYHAQMFEALEHGTIAEYYAGWSSTDDEVEGGVAEGRLVVDTRAARRPSADRRRRDGAPLPRAHARRRSEYAVEAASLGEADVVRLQRRLDELEHRLASVELSLPNRLYRKAVGPANRVLRRGPRSEGGR